MTKTKRTLLVCKLCRKRFGLKFDKNEGWYCTYCNEYTNTVNLFDLK